MDRMDWIDRGGYIGEALRRAEESGVFTKVREGHDAAWMKTHIDHLQQVLPMDFKELNNYFVRQGWLSVDARASKASAATGGADPAFKGTRDIEKVGMAAAVAKTYIEGSAVGIRQLADNFLRKIDLGDERAYVEGMQFAQQMQHLSRFGGYVLGWDQGMGRALRVQGLRKQSDMGLIGSDEYMKRLEDNYGNLGEYANKFQEIAAKLQDPTMRTDGVGELISLARRVKFLDDPRKIAKVSMSLEVAGNAWREVVINGLLSSPATLLTNATAVTWAVARPLSQLAAAGLYSAAGLPGSGQAATAAAEAAAALAGMASSFMDAAQLGWHAFKSETSIYQAGAGQELAQRAGIHGERVLELAERRGWDAPSDALLDTVTLLGSYLRIPSRAMMGMDEMVKHMVVRGEVQARAVQSAVKAGVDPWDLNALRPFIKDEMDAAFNLNSPELHQKYAVKSIYQLNTGIMAEADRATFQEVNGYAAKVSQLLNKGPGQALMPFIPFVRTPLNILKQGAWESTGLQALSRAGGALAGAGFNPTKASLEITRQLLEDPGESFRVAGQVALTTSLMATFYTMAMNGAVVGGGPGRWSSGGRNSDSQRAWEKAMREQGRSPYTIKIGDVELPFDRFGEPVAILLRMASDAGMYSSYVSHAEQEEWLTAMASIAVSGLYQATFLRGVNDVMDLVSDPSSTWGVKGGRAVQNWMSTQMPFGGLLNYVDKMVDPYKHAYQGASFLEVMRVHEDTFGTGIFGKIADRIPGYGGTPALVDQITGQPVPAVPGGGPTGLNPLQMAVPWAPRGVKGADGVWTAIYNIKGGYAEKRPPARVLQLTHSEQQELNRRMASMRIGGMTVSQAIMRYYRRPEVQAYVGKKGAAFADTRTKIESDFDSIITSYYQAAYNGYVLDNLSLRSRAIMGQEKLRAQRENDPQRATAIQGQMDALFDEARSRGL